MIKAFILMLQFLTRLPINIPVDMDSKTLSRGAFFFPFVGVVVGLISGGVYYLFQFINNDIASLSAVFTIIFVTGGIHVDGLSDTADGFFSARSKERILEIMKDSRVGTFGVIAIIFDILAKYVIIKNIPAGLVIPALIFSCALGRTASSMLFSFGKSARPGGMGDMFTANPTKKYFISATIILTVIGLVTVRTMFLIALVSVVIFALLLMKLSYKTIDGLTGDVYGACTELCEIVSLTVFMAVSLWR
ncbi:hypothetical protein Q428_03775 [Fervidicella metallireducens AeB]|uniref:Adenosylcobinamide-GDP ribazoletransferase n=1 Tax=Fervidicella metallireducens AeB TaxID=1403537 RepID=A0A017RXX1_9CLOT|nr:adenosylcobinamide-GDP ribazoletransferase [Fervidicella metallireducens]EYE89254.1 hypothetical protein Q428_03775 [Fervidicella metallireducens AeB]